MSLFRKFLLILPVGLIFAITGWGQTAAFEGTVKGTDGKPLPGAQVKIDRQDVKGNYSVKTDKKGHYFYGGLPLGIYKISVVMDGQERDVRVPVRTKVGETEDISFDLAAAAGPRRSTRKDALKRPLKKRRMKGKPRNRSPRWPRTRP